MSGPRGIERRKTQRRPVLDTFSLFVVIPKKGSHKLKVYDVSEGGLRFDYDLEGEPADLFPVRQGEEFELHFYLNQRLFVPLKVKVARIENVDSIRRIGAEISGASRTYDAFLKMLDGIVDEAQLSRG